MLPGGYSPSERPRVAEEFEMEHHPDRVRRASGGKGVWIALALVILLVGAVVLLLSMMPEG